MSALSIVKSPPVVIPLASYTATVGTDLIDTGTRLQCFVEEIRGNWPVGSGEDVAVWSGQPGHQRLVALIRDDLHGVPASTWL